MVFKIYCKPKLYRIVSLYKGFKILKFYKNATSVCTEPIAHGI
ncbi:hypothetical protein [uncultured Campylobacter sp.]|nr:hypothetical protein [uncultured Campylobacter sp.]